MVTGMLQVLSISVYSLLYPCSTLSFFNSSTDKNIDVPPDVLSKTCLVTTLVGDSVVD